MSAVLETKPETATAVDFLWLELTNTCNLECVHCYANSSPRWVDQNPLTLSEYTGILRDTAAHGCTAVQFIGGEPTLNRLLPDLVTQASETGYEFIEVYTNLVSLDEKLIDLFLKRKVSVATSVYSFRPEVHDLITTRPGSWSRTMRNLKKLVSLGIPVRASIIRMPRNERDVARTEAYLTGLGVERVGIDDAREFGRAEAKKTCDMGELCGQCSKGTLCVDPEGSVSPCIMSKAWPVGDVRTNSVSEIIRSAHLRAVRTAIREHTLDISGLNDGGCNPSSPHRCGPDGQQCSPCSPNGHCAPNACAPK